MEFLTFSQFAKKLYPYCGHGKNEDEFVIALTDKIIGGRPGRAIGTDNYKNPMRSKNIRTLQAYFEGTRSISKQNASEIYSKIDRYRFEQFLMQETSDDAQKMLKVDLAEYLPDNDKRSIAEICADLFAEILKKLASR